MPSHSIRLATIFGLFSIVLCSGWLFWDLVPLGYENPIFSLRHNRACLALLTGAVLSACGCALQSIFQNPLADPYILGTSGAAALGATFAFLLGNTEGFYSISFFAFIFSLFSHLFLLSFLKQKSPNWSANALLCGIALNTFCAACITLAKSLAPTAKTQMLLFWLMGHIDYLPTQEIIILSCIVGVGLWLLWLKRGALNCLQLGDEEARRLGIDATKEKRIVYLTCSFLTGIVVAQTGLIGFVGMLVPQTLGLFWGSNMHLRLPLSMLYGSVFLFFFDILAQKSFYVWHSELPVGSLCAFVCAPFFIFLLRRQIGSQLSRASNASATTQKKDPAAFLQYKVETIHENTTLMEFSSHKNIKNKNFLNCHGRVSSLAMTLDSCLHEHDKVALPLFRLQNFNIQNPSGILHRNFNFTAYAGQITAIIGPNGIGKSTLLNQLAGIYESQPSLVIPAQAGIQGSSNLLESRLRGNDNSSKSWISSLAQNYQCPIEMLAYERIAHGLVPIYGSNVQIDKKNWRAIESIAYQLQIQELLYKKLQDLSGGEQKKVHLARAFIQAANIYILDEPLAFLDALYQKFILDFLKNKAKKGACIIASFHEMSLLKNNVDQIISLN